MREARIIRDAEVADPGIVRRANEAQTRDRGTNGPALTGKMMHRAVAPGPGYSAAIAMPGSRQVPPESDDGACHKRKWALFDHLVGAGEEGGWDRQTDFLSGLQIDDQFEPSRLLDGQLGRFASFENFRDIVGRSQHHLWKVGTVGDETARVDPFAERMQDWEPLSARKLGQELRVADRALFG